MELNSQNQNKSLDSLLSIVKTERQDTVYVKNLIKICDLYIQQEAFKEAKRFAQMALTCSNKINYRKGIVKANMAFSRVYLECVNYDSTIFINKKLLSLLDSIHDNTSLAKIYRNLGAAYLFKGNYNLSLPYFMRSLKMFEFLKNTNGMMSCITGIASIYNVEGNTKKAIQMYLQAEKLAIKNRDERLLATIYNNMGVIYENNNEKALFYYKKSLPIKEKIGNKDQIAMTVSNIGQIYIKQKKYAEAISAYNKILIIAKETGNKRTLCLGFIGVGTGNQKLNNISEAEKNLKQGLNLAVEMGDKSSSYRAYTELIELYEKKADFKQALKYHKLQAYLKDSVFNVENNTQINEMSAKYETEKKDKELIKKDRAIEKLNHEKEKILLENKLRTAQKEKRTILLFYVTISFGILLFLTFGYINIKRWQKRQKQFTAQLINSQEEERKRISKELHDGIGQNLLTLKNAYSINIPLMESTIEDLNNISRNMHPVLLEKLGLIKAVESVINEAKESTKIMFSYELHEVNNLLTQSQQINLFRIVQESLRNIIKHSQTTAAKITILKDGDKIITSIYDKGKGFDIKEARNKKSLGLTSITERVELIGGKLNITSNNNGTRIDITLKNG